MFLEIKIAKKMKYYVCAKVKAATSVKVKQQVIVTQGL